MDAKITQTEIAARVGVRQSYISDLLNRKKRPSPEVAARLEGVTGVHRLSWLYPGQYDDDGRPLFTAAPTTQPEEKVRHDA